MPANGRWDLIRCLKVNGTHSLTLVTGIEKCLCNFCTPFTEIVNICIIVHYLWQINVFECGHCWNGIDREKPQNSGYTSTSAIFPATNHML